MNKKFWIAFVIVFITMGLFGYLVHGVALSPLYQRSDVSVLMRPQAEMMGMMWIYYVVYFVQSFIVTLIYTKAYAGGTIVDGMRYGLTMGLLLTTPMAYASYAMYPIPYELALQWFLYGMVEYGVLGMILSLAYRPKTKPIIM